MWHEPGVINAWVISKCTKYPLWSCVYLRLGALQHFWSHARWLFAWTTVVMIHIQWERTFPWRKFGKCGLCRFCCSVRLIVRVRGYGSGLFGTLARPISPLTHSVCLISLGNWSITTVLWFRWKNSVSIAALVRRFHLYFWSRSRATLVPRLRAAPTLSGFVGKIQWHRSHSVITATHGHFPQVGDVWVLDESFYHHYVNLNLYSVPRWLSPQFA